MKKLLIAINYDPEFINFQPIDGRWSFLGGDLDEPELANEIGAKIARKYHTNRGIKVELFRSDGRALYGEEHNGNFVATLQLKRR